MLISQVPPKFPIPFGASAGGAYIRPIPQASQIGIQPNAASLTDGFPPATMTSGGWPYGQDFNGILKQITLWSQWQGAGALTPFDSVYSTAIGGYPQTALLASSTPGTAWLSLIDNNTDNPDGGSVNWVQVATSLLIQRGQTIFGIASGTDTYAAAPVASALNLLSLVEGMQVLTFFANANLTTSPTFDWNNIGVVNLLKRDGTAPVAGDITGWLSLLFDGSAWRVNGYVASDIPILLGPYLPPKKLPGNVTYFINPVTGNDTWDGTSATHTSGTTGPWATLNHAYSFLQTNINANGFTITLSCAFPNSPTSYGQFIANGGIPGVFNPAQLVIVGDNSGKQCQISVSLAHDGAIDAKNGAQFSISGFNLINSGTLAVGLFVTNGANVFCSNMLFGACAAYAVQVAFSGSNVTFTGTNSFNGSCLSAMRASENATFQIGASTINFSAISFSGGTVSATNAGGMLASIVTYTGSVPTGPKWILDVNSYLQTDGALNVPGSTAGTTAHGAQAV